MENQEQLDQNIKDSWFAKVGVRKPYTIFVCIMAIIVLGVFAFSKMSVDLFPSMNLPYAVVVLSPNESYLMEKYSEKIADVVEQSTTAVAGNAQYTADPAKLESDALILAQVLAGKLDQSAITADNEVAIACFTSVIQSPNEILASVMPNSRQMENLTDTALSALSGVNGIKNTNSTTMLSVGLVMITLEYNADAMVDLTALALAFENLALDDTIAYGTKFNKTISDFTF